jgi:putative Holliday junction resolvase
MRHYRKGEMKYLGIDYGLKRTGVAASDTAGNMAFPRCTLLRKNRAQFWRSFDALMAAERPDALAVGLPLRANGTDSETTLHVRAFVKELKRRYTVPVFQVDELLTSFAAKQDLRDAYEHTGSAWIRENLDQQAAVHILESFLRQRDQNRKLFA